MTPLLKVVGIGAFGAIGLTSIYFFSQSSEGSMPPWSPASDDSIASTDYTSGKYANKYKRYLVGVGTRAASKTPQSNTLWWKWSFLKNYSKKEGDKSGFKDVTDETSLEAACKSAYKSENSKIKENPTTGNEFKESDIWKYCSPIGQKPTTVSSNNDSYESSHMASDSNHKTQLISTKDNKNQIFWDIRQEEFFENSGTFSGSSAEAGGFFKAYYDKEITKNKENRESLKSKCEEAYSKATSESGSNTEAKKSEVLKYCSLEGTTA